MQQAPIPGNESARLQALAALEIYGTEPEERFDRIARLAARLTRAPRAYVNLVGQDFQWTKASLEPVAEPLERSATFCGHAVYHGAPLVIPDARADARFADNPLVASESGIRAYAGFPLTVHDGLPVGTLCVIDTVPRSFTSEELDDLSDLACLVMDELELRWTTQRLSEAQRQSEQAREALTELNGALREARDQAEAASQAKSDFISSLSHELRNPLNAILGFSELLYEETATLLSAQHRVQLSHIHQAGQHLRTLLDEVLDLARIESGRVHLETEPVRLGQAVQETLALLGDTLLEDAMRPRLEIEIPENADIQVTADRVRLRQVLINLISNALKYNKPSGWVRVTADVDSDQHVQIHVIDNGIGIPEERMAELFQPFNRLGRDGSTTPGHGVGLAVTRQLVQAMAGEIEVRSRPGEGSTFTVTLPRARRGGPPGHGSPDPGR